MQTPNTKAGRLTEKLMANILIKFPELKNETAAYNRMYEVILATLNREKLK